MKASIQLNRIIRIHLLFLILLLLPTCGYSSQKYVPDTTYVLVIDHFQKHVKKEGEEAVEYWRKRSKVSYIRAGSIVNVKLRDNREISQGRLFSIDKDSCHIEGHQFPISEIQEISLGTKLQRNSAKGMGILLLILGSILGGFWIGFFFFAFGGSDFEDAPGTFLGIMLLPVLIMIAGINKLRNSGGSYNFKGQRARISAKPLSSLPEKIQEKLTRKLFIN